jgi:hypothetical protein
VAAPKVKGFARYFVDLRSILLKYRLKRGSYFHRGPDNHLSERFTSQR